MIRDGASRLRIHVTDRIRATAWAVGLIADVLVSTIEISRSRSVRAYLLVFQRPGLLRTINLFEVGDTGTALAGSASLHEVGNRDRGQQANDGYDDHNFNEREPSFTTSCYLHLF
jgi:hypothetical protein